MSRIRQKDLAEALGLHRSTVSKALKGDPAIAEATREKVRREAEKRGFRPDPVLAALARYRKRPPAPFRESIAWLHNYPKSTDMSLYAGHDAYFRGAAARCEELGYKLEPIWVDGRRIRLRRLPGILEARGIRAVIFAPQANVGVRMEFPVEYFCVLTIGYSLAAPEMDIITNDHFTTMTTLLERLRAEGHQRIGCYLWENDNERMGRRARSAFHAYSREFSCSVRTYREFKPSVFSRWLRSQQLDAVIGRGSAQADAVRAHSRRHGTRLRFAGYAVEDHETAFSGMSHNNHQIGAAAADCMAAKLQRGEFGPPAVPKRLLIAGTWVGNSQKDPSKP